MTLRLIRAALFALIAFGVFSVVYTAYWFYVARAFREGLPAWIEQLAGNGATLAYRQLEISGYPFEFRLIFHEPLLDAPALPALGGKPLRWRSSRITALMPPWNFRHYSIDLAGDHRIDWPADRATRIVNLTAGEFLVRTDMRSDGLPGRAEFDVARLRIAEGASNADPLWQVGRARVAMRRLFPETDIEIKPTFKMEFRLEDVRLPPGDLPLGRDVARFTGEASIVGELTNAASADELSRWREAGGIVEYTLNEGRYGPLVLNANGTAALDDSLQPMTAGTAKVEGLFPAIDALRARDLVRSRDAAMAKVVLGVLSRPGENGGASSISLPYSIQGQKLYVGPVPLMDVPTIQWPQPRVPQPRIVR
jgi:hypothetical protein